MELKIELTATIIVDLIRALDDKSMGAGADLAEMLYDHGRALCGVASLVDGVIALEFAAAGRDLTDHEEAALKAAETSSLPWLRKKAAEIRDTLKEALLPDIAEDDRAVCDASSVDAVDPIRDNIAGTRVRYIGEVELIKGKCGVLTGTKRTPEEICVECVEVKIDGITWAIPCEFPQFVVCDASEVSR